MSCNPLTNSASLDAVALKVLFAGFPEEHLVLVESALRKKGWVPTFVREMSAIEAAWETEQFDVAVIDTKHIEVFAPDAIRRFRNCSYQSRNATILAVDEMMFEGLRDQLEEAGAHLVGYKPIDPTQYVFMLEQAKANKAQSEV